MRSPLAIGNVYRYPGYPNHGFHIKAFSFPGTASDDGGLPGVFIKWLNRSRREYWYPFSSEVAFWKDLRFSNAVDGEGG